MVKILLSFWNGFSNIGNFETRRMGEFDRRMVLRPTSWCFCKYFSPLCMALLTLFAVHNISRKSFSFIIQFEKCSHPYLLYIFAQLSCLFHYYLLWFFICDFINNDHLNKVSRVKRRQLFSIVYHYWFVKKIKWHFFAFYQVYKPKSAVF